eukprot:TRINITY_DN297_c0_g1_i6.p1 TRINITY_DN297_c0_g1~~TRINITY_DN297_c0_g1_i6.p1  ORF type:complete len:2532 (+),score=507.88 TRINITY_DN297_c0_g1_i6:500-8095(+)
MAAQPPTRGKCKFDTKCNSESCPYEHTQPVCTTTGCTGQKGGCQLRHLERCFYDLRCNNPKCWRVHSKPVCATPGCAGATTGCPLRHPNRTQPTPPLLPSPTTPLLSTPTPPLPLCTTPPLPTITPTTPPLAVHSQPICKTTACAAGPPAFPRQQPTKNYRTPAPSRIACRVHLEGLPNDATNEELLSVFTAAVCAHVNSTDDKGATVSGFIEFASPEQRRAVLAGPHLFFRGFEVVVSEATALDDNGSDDTTVDPRLNNGAQAALLLRVERTPEATSCKQLLTVFGDLGAVDATVLPSGALAGKAFVLFDTTEHRDNAISTLQGAELYGMKLTLAAALPNEVRFSPRRGRPLRPSPARHHRARTGNEVLIKPLTPTMGETSLLCLLEKYNPTKVCIKKHKGCAFVSLPSTEDVRRACKELDGSTWGGTTIQVSLPHSYAYRSPLSSSPSCSPSSSPSPGTRFSRPSPPHGVAVSLPPCDPLFTLHVASLPFSATEEKLLALFHPFQPTRISVKRKDAPTAYAFVSLPTAELVDAAIKELNGAEYEGSHIVVTKKREPRSAQQKNIAAAGTAATAAVTSGHALPNETQRTHQLPERLLTREDRDQQRQKAALPIMQCRNEFYSRIAKEQVVVCVAETGSGKTTQLPQYAAEAVTGLVICTQPRQIAALSLAERVAREYDGTSPGHSVGYEAAGKRVRGERILFLTDSALVRRATRDPLLSGVSVVMIDEAHERSLYTDIALGICKQVLEKRPTDFHVIVASATIDETQFLTYFNCKQPALKVPGRQFAVTEQYAPPDGAVALATGNATAFVQNYVVPTVLEQLKHSEGHTLVFLPGQAEIEKAIQEFSRKAPPCFVSLPLFGSLPPEEQKKVLDFDAYPSNKDKRMVVFCTNVAETSLTVPGVRLVIDSGLAKEAVYDPARRLTVLELKYISQSSSEQRKGRAGRVCAGACVRLHKLEDITRKSIEPEILRSSLDAVVLQLKRMNQDPLQFPYLDMDDAHRRAISSSVTLMQQLGFVDHKTGNVTQLGQLASEIDFDPRLCSFVLESHRYGKLDLGLAIAGVLSAPGSIFFMGSKVERIGRQGRVAMLAAKYESDLLFLHSVFESWRNSGKSVNRGVCLTCNKPATKGVCTGCQVVFSNKEGLNNKVLKIVDRTVFEIKKMLQLPQWQPVVAALPQLPPLDDLEAIGNCLSRAFLDQLIEVLVPVSPSSGVRVVIADERGKIERTSCVAQRKRELPPRYFLAMKTTHLPSGVLLVDQLHPVTCNTIKAAAASDWCVQHRVPTDPVVASCWDNVGPECEAGTKKAFDELTRNDEKWATLIFDNTSSSLKLYCPTNTAALGLNRALDNALRTKREELLSTAATETVGNGTAYVTVKSGLRVSDVGLVSGAKCLSFCDLPPEVKSTRDFHNWLLTKLGLSNENILWHSFRSRLGRVTLTAAAQTQAKTAYKQWHSSQNSGNDAEEAEGDLQSSASLSQLWGRSLSGFLQGVHTEQEVRCVIPDALCVSLRSSYTVRMTRVPLSGPLEQIQAQVATVVESACGKSATQRVSVVSDTKSTSLARIFVSVSETRSQQVYNALQNHYSLFNCVLLPPQRQLWSAVFPSPWHASQAMQSLGESWCASNTVTVVHSELFDLPKMFADIQGRYNGYGVTFSQKMCWGGGTTVTVHCKDPATCGKAAQLLFADTRPIRLHASQKNHLQFLLYCEVANSLKQWEQQSGLHMDAFCSSNQVSLDIFGPRTAQGELMMKLGEYADDFNKRCTTFRLRSVDTGVLCPGHAGHHILANLRKAYDCLILEANGAITIKAELKSASSMNQCRNDMKQQLLDVCNVEEVLHTNCECGLAGDFALSVCGHWCCRRCFQQQATSGDPMVCHVCHTPVPLGDLRAQLSKDVLRVACEAAATTYLAQHPAAGLAQCPAQCGAIMQKEALYQECHRCTLWVCPACQQVSQEGHRGRTCAAFKEWKADMVPCPNEGCDGMVSRNRMYHLCVDCGRMVCPVCRVVDAKWHANRSCTEYQAYKADMAPCPSSECASFVSMAAGYCNCTGCNNQVCGACRVTNCELHSGRPCAEYRRLNAAGMTTCPTKCGGVVPSSGGYTRCSGCQRMVCVGCGAVNEPLHTGCSCAELAHRKAANMTMCPNPSGCTGVVSSDAPQTCSVCGAFVCMHCRMCCTSGSSAHAGKTCEEYDRCQSFDKLASAAVAWARSNWSTGVAAIDRVDINPGLARNCVAMQRFKHAFARNDLAQLIPPCTSSFFTWHGSPESAIFSICDKGWDTQRRSGQAHGPGEYFGENSAVSCGYCHGGKFMIVALVLQNPCVTHIQNFCYVVNNPTGCNAQSFCLPVAVVSFGGQQGYPHFVGATDSSGEAAVAACGSNPEWKTPFRWSWRMDNGDFELYPDLVSQLIEHSYEAYAHNNGAAVTTVVDVTRYIDDRPQTYLVDFRQSTQTNTRTSYVRAIQRKQVAVLGGALWQHLAASGQWENYDSAVQGTIERAYQQYRAGAAGVVLVQPPGRPETYSLDFVTGVQTNTVSGHISPIKRV